MLKEISKVEQRYDAVLMVIRDGFTVSEVARKIGVSRQSVYSWMARYDAEGLTGLEDRSHRPHVVPHQTPAEIEALVVEMRLAHHRWGAARLAHELKRRGHVPPSQMAIYRMLRRRGLIEATKKTKQLEHRKRWERGRPMELWQMDIVGGVLTTAGQEAKILTGIDDHSRFIVCAGIMARATLRPVCAHLLEALECYGVPEEILTDNGKVFTARFGHPDSETMFDRICRENAIKHRLSPPHTPTAAGKIERFHRTLREEFLTGRVFADLTEAQNELDQFIAHYNEERPHSAKQMQPPATFFIPNTGALALDVITPTSRLNRGGPGWISRTVNVNGVITVSGQQASVGKSRSGRVVDVCVTERTLEVYDGAELVKAIKRLTTGEVRKKRAESKNGG